jgi:uncharacterized protein
VTGNGVTNNARSDSLKSILCALLLSTAVQAQDSAYTRTEAMVPMRDGVRLFTVILSPRQATSPQPLLMDRTPYGVAGPISLTRYAELAADGYIFVFQDIRGRYRSEGTFVMNRPQRRDGSGTDESTDTYDTIEWLLKNVPNNNGRVGIFGVSYPGWLTAVAGIGAHPALKAISPQAPMGDTWLGDDFFHQGAFRLTYGLEYTWELEASKDESVIPSPARYDTYEWYRSFPTLTGLANAVGANDWPTWRRFVEHPSYDSVWKNRSLGVTFAHTTVPTLVVGGWWDQEDEFGPLLTYRTLSRTDTARIVSLVMGPWSHGQWANGPGTKLGNVLFGGHSTGAEFRALEAKWFAHWLHDAPGGTLPAATVFDAGTDEWRTYDHWPATGTARRFYFRADGVLSTTAPVDAGADQYVSDPAHPIPYRPRPVERTYSDHSRWYRWETEDQRFVDGRPDVLTWQTAPLTSDVTIAGNVVAHLFASTTGSDADWVVKLIDVYPDTIPDNPEMGGYELMVTGDIMRGRYRASFEHPAPIPPNQVEPFTVDLHQQSYTFRAGHRIMVQVQSTWFPLYDRNPQTFVPNIFQAHASDYQPRVHRIYRSARYPSNVEVDEVR